MILKTSGIVLRQDPFSKTSKVITWLTPDHGRMATLAKGAQRKKSGLVGQFDCFYTCELLFYPARHSSLHLLRECSPEAPRSGLRDNWRASAGASYLCDLVNRLTPPGAAAGPLFAWAGSTLDFIEKQGFSIPVMHWMELQLMGLLGMAPQLRRCITCGKEDGTGTGLWFSVARGGVVCTPCQGKLQDPTAAPIAPDVLAMMRGWERAHSPLIARRTSYLAGQLDSANRILGAFMDYHSEGPRARRILFELLG